MAAEPSSGDLDAGLSNLPGPAGEQAFDRLFEKHQGKFLAVLWRRLRQDAEDARQEFFVRMRGRRCQFTDTSKGERGWEAWMSRCADHFAIDRLRRKRKGTDSLVDEIGIDDPPGQRLDAEEKREAFLDCVGRLPVRLKEAAVALAALQEAGPDERKISARQVGEVIGLEHGAARARLIQAREHVRRCMESKGHYMGAGR